jgi:diguanylate cyclase (GGDEF)-like protein
MTSGSAISTEFDRHPIGVPRTRLFAGPPRAVLVELALALAAVAAVVLALVGFHWHPVAVVRAVVIVVLALSHIESSAVLLRLRHDLASPPRINAVGVWIVAGIVCLPLSYAAAIVPLLSGYQAIRGDPDSQVRPGLLFGVSSATLAGGCAALGVRDLHPTASTQYGGRVALTVIVAVTIFVVVAEALGALLRYLMLAERSWRASLPSADYCALQLAIMVLGALTGLTVLNSIFLAPAALVLIELIRRSSTVSQLQVAATTDAKTGLLNVAAWEVLAQRELLRAKRDRTPGAVLLLDLDHFKKLNDTLGHLRGDIALRAVAETLKRELRGYDAVARFGGEEFVVFLNDLPIEGAAVVAERILTRIRNLSISGSDATSERYHLTASIGLASYPELGTTVSELLEAADLALYGAKHAGRDRIGRAGSDHDPSRGTDRPVSAGHNSETPVLQDGFGPGGAREAS